MGTETAQDWATIAKRLAKVPDALANLRAAGVTAADGKTDSESLIKAFEGLDFKTPDGKTSFRKIDHQATWRLYVGKLAMEDGKGVMVDYHYAPGDTLLPSDDDVLKLRPAD